MTRRSALAGAVALLLSGCGKSKAAGDGGPDGPAGDAGLDASPDGGAIHLSWVVLDPSNGLPRFCAPGEQVLVKAEAQVNAFPCGAGAGTTGPLVPAVYLGVFELHDAGGALESMMSFPVIVALGQVTEAGEVRFQAPLGSASGSAVFSWELRVGSPTGPMGSCGHGGTVVRFDFGPIGSQELPCEEPQPATIGGVPAGSYTVQAALTANGQPASNTVGGIPVDVPANGSAPEQHIVFVVAQ